MWSVWLVFCDCGFHSVYCLKGKDKRLMEASWWKGLTLGETGSCSGGWGHAQEKVKLLSFVRLFAAPWTVAHQAPPPMEFSRQEYWSGLPFPSPGDLPDPGIEPWSPSLQADTYHLSHQGSLATNSSILAWTISRTEELAGYTAWDHKGLGMTEWLTLVIY